MKISTEGVLILASAQGLLDEYQGKEFDYDFPDGLSNLLKRQAIIALTTQDGDDLIIEFVDADSGIEEDFDREIAQVITLAPQDQLLILSHAQFTEICDANGNSEGYRWPIEKIEPIAAGKYLVNIKIKDTASDFDTYKAYFKLSISMTKVAHSYVINEVVDLSD